MLFGNNYEHGNDANLHRSQQHYNMEQQQQPQQPLLLSPANGIDGRTIDSKASSSAAAAVADRPGFYAPAMMAKMSAINLANLRKTLLYVQRNENADDVDANANANNGNIYLFIENDANDEEDGIDGSTGSGNSANAAPVMAQGRQKDGGASRFATTTTTVLKRNIAIGRGDGFRPG